MLDPENFDENSKKLFKYLMSQNHLSVFCKDLDSRFFNCNTSSLVDCGMNSRSNLIGKSDYDLIWTPEEAAFFRLVDKEVMEYKIPKLCVVEEQTDHRRRKRWIETNKFPILDPSGNVIGLMGYYVERK